jgi:5-bromo-4-chloroindolyl phosphate hydrolysis protein
MKQEDERAKTQKIAAMTADDIKLNELKQEHYKLFRENLKEAQQSKGAGRANMFHNIKQTDQVDSGAAIIRRGKPFATHDQVNHVSALVHRSQQI